MFICTTCQCALTLGMLKTHKKHSTMALPKKMLETIAQAADITTFPVMEPTIEPRFQIAGLSVKTGEGCPHCPYAAARQKVTQHMSVTHPGSTQKRITNMQTQVLNSGVTKFNFRVKPRPSIAGLPVLPSILEEYEKMDWHNPQSREIPNARRISPFLMRTNWHNHIEPFTNDIPHLCELVAMPNESEFALLHSSVHKYFDHATALLSKTEELVLQKVNSADIDKE